MLTLLPLLALAQEPVPIELIYTGGAGGIGSGRWGFDLLDAREHPDIRAHHGAMVGGDVVALAEDRRVATLAAFLAGSPTCEPPVAGQIVREGQEFLLLDAPHGGEPADVHRCRVGDAVVRVVTPLGVPVPSDGSAFELRLAVELPGLGDLIARPDDDGARRVGLLRALRQAHPDAIFVDAGSFVDGISSVRDHTLSLHRPTLFDALRDLRPAALVPGRAELAAGARALRQEAGDLPWVATNWQTDDPDLALPSAVEVDVSGVRVAFLGVVDPEIAAWVPGLEVTLADPVTALDARIATLTADLVVVLTEQPDTVRHVAGVDLILGDPGPSTQRIRAIEVTLRDTDDDRPALTLPLDGVGLGTAYLRDGTLTAVHATPHPVTADLDPDPTVRAAVRAVRLAEYPEHDRPLLDALPMGGWAAMVCEALRARAHADLAFLPALPPAPDVQGPLTELLVLDALALLDVVEVHDVLGESVPRMLNKAYETVPVACGAPLGAKSPTIAGRAVEPDRIYRVATTARIHGDPVLSALITEGRPTRLLDRAHPRIVTQDGAPLTLRRAVLSQLRQGRGDASPAPSFQDKTPQWVLRARPLSLSIEGFRGVDDDAYADIPETLATSPSALTIASVDDLQLEYSSRGIVWDARGRLAYTRLTTEEDAAEPSDDLKLSTSASLPGLALPVPTGPMPFGEVLYDTELTAVENEDGTFLPVQRDLSLTLGLSGRWGALKTARIGAFALRDLSVLEKPIETGGRTEIFVSLPLGRGLVWNTGLDAYLWADTPEEDASDLRFKALADSRLELPLAWWLRVALYARVFGFQGRIPRTSAPAASASLGAALDLTGAFHLR